MKHVGVTTDPNDVGVQRQLPRRYEQDTAPTGTRRSLDTWLDTSSGITYEWVVTGGVGQWVERAAGLPIVTTGYDIEITDATRGLILRSPDGTRWRVTIDNAGTLTRTSL